MGPYLRREGAVCTRRDFVSALALLTASVALTRAGRAQTRNVTLKVGLLTSSPGTTDVTRGFELGAEEAARAAELFRGRFMHQQGASVLALVESGCTVIVGAAAAGAVAAAAQREASARGAVYLNAASMADSLRDAECGRLAFHVAPSRAMLGSAGARLVVWDPRLRRYGAEQLNDRYRHRFGRDMSGDAWLGWMAAKIAWEATLRAGSPRGADVAAMLLRQGTGFDGHKGRALRFAAADRQLYYPLYEPDRLRESVPAPGALTAHGRGACGR